VPALDVGAAVIHVPARYQRNEQKTIKTKLNPKLFRAQEFKRVQKTQNECDRNRAKIIIKTRCGKENLLRH
tara:strand:+ start:330 stop:542 length:213 start_codon:yes stop_codon:yes gene_type:complete